MSTGLDIYTTPFLNTYHKRLSYDCPMKELRRIVEKRHFLRHNS